MRVLVTGHRGYIGSVLVRMLQTEGHEVVGLDSYLFEDCAFGPEPPFVPALRKDIRDMETRDCEGFEAVIHLAALSNDPLGDLKPEITYEINHRATVRLARLAKQAGVARFLHSSSCSLYGAGGQDLLTEEASFHPITAYGISKVLVEQEVSPLADDTFSPTFLRNATAYGVSPRLRGDLVVNNLVGYAVTLGEILLKSDGTPWRPVIHVEDISRAFLAVLHAPRELIHNQAFNVGLTTENYRVRDLAAMVQEVVPGSTVRYADGAGPDPRCYRVDCTKLSRTLPGFRPRWTARAGIKELYDAYRSNGLNAETFLGPRYLRIRHVRALQSAGRLDERLRWRSQAVAA